MLYKSDKYENEVLLMTEKPGILDRIENKEKETQYKYVSPDGSLFNSAAELNDYLEQMKKEQEEFDNGNKNPAFIQITKGIAPNLFRQLSKSGIEVIMFLLDNLSMNDVNIISVSQATIADELNISRQSVMRGVKELTDLKVLYVGKVGTSNVYIINPDVAWANSYRKRQSLVLKGSIILGHKENEELFKRFAEVEKKSLQRETQKVSIGVAKGKEKDE